MRVVAIMNGYCDYILGSECCGGGVLQSFHLFVCMPAEQLIMCMSGFACILDEWNLLESD